MTNSHEKQKAMLHLPGLHTPWLSGTQSSALMRAPGTLEAKHDRSELYINSSHVHSAFPNHLAQTNSKEVAWQDASVQEHRNTLTWQRSATPPPTDRMSPVLRHWRSPTTRPGWPASVHECWTAGHPLQASTRPVMHLRACPPDTCPLVGKARHAYGHHMSQGKFFSLLCDM